MGIIGLALILVIYSSILLASIKLYKNLRLYNPQAKGMVIIFWGCTAVYIINSLFIQMRYFEFVNSIFFIFAGLIYRMGKECDVKTC